MDQSQLEETTGSVATTRTPSLTDETYAQITPQEHPGIRLTRKRMVTLNVEFAQAHLALATVGESERPLRNDHVDYLRGSMKRQLFRAELVHLMTAHCLETDEVVRINGQHCCWAVVSSDPPAAYQVQLLEYVCDTMLDVRTLYSTVDRGKERSNQHVTAVIMYGHEEFQGARKRDISNLAAGAAFWKHGANSKKLPAEARTELLLNTLPELTQKVKALLEEHKCSNDTQHIHRAPVVAAMFATVDRAPRDAKEFWNTVCHGVGVESKDDPRAKLRTYLIQTKLSTRVLQDSATNSDSAENMFRHCIQCWNAHREGRQLKYLRLANADERPKVHK